MRLRLLAAVSFALVAAACQDPNYRQSATALRTVPVGPPVASASAVYPGSYIDARGYRVDAGSYTNWSTVAPTQSAALATSTPPRTGGNGPVAWTDRGYSYDQWGNLISAPGQPNPRPYPRRTSP